MSNSILELEDISKRFGSEQALDGLDLSLQDDEILTLIGPSGSGKTTALRIIAGLEEPDEGEVKLRGEAVNGSTTMVPPERRSVGFVFQDLALFPHMTVAENVAFGLTESRKNRRDRVDEVLELVGLTDYRDRYPENLSGGQKQRVALARSLVVQPSVLLLDEPFSNLDKELRDHLRKEVRDILRRSEIPALFVTHDQEEAIFFGDRTAVMAEGSVKQVDEPEALVSQPDNRFVAEFLGPTEFLSAKKKEGQIETEISTLSEDMVDAPDSKSFDLMVRADDIAIEQVDNGDADGSIADAEFLGDFFRCKIRLKSGKCIYSLLNHGNPPELDASVRVDLKPGHKLVGFDKAGSEVQA